MLENEIRAYRAKVAQARQELQSPIQARVNDPSRIRRLYNRLSVVRAMQRRVSDMEKIILANLLMFTADGHYYRHPF